MAKKLDLNRIPNNVQELKKLLDVHKDKEARLEADLVIRSNEEIKESVIKIMLCIAEIRELDNIMQTLAQSPVIDEEEKLAIQNSIKYFEQKVETLQESEDLPEHVLERLDKLVKFYSDKIEHLETKLKCVSEGRDDKYQALSERRTGFLIQLKSAVDEVKGLKLFRIIPSLNDFKDLLGYEDE